MIRWGITLLTLSICYRLSRTDEVFTTEDLKALRNVVLSRAGSSGDFGASAKDAYFGSGTLTLLGPMEKAQKGVVCRVASTQLASDAVDLEMAYYASQILGTAGCGDAKAEAQAEKVAVAALESGVNGIRSAYYAVSTLAALGRTAPAKALDSALQLLQKLKASKGRLRDTPKGAASLTATAHGYLIAAAAQRIGTIGSQHLPAVESLLSGIPQVLETAAGKGFLSDAHDDALEAITYFVQGIEATCSDECNLDKSQLAEVAKLLASARRVGSVQDAYYVLSGLSLLTSTGKLPKPVAISLLSASVPSSSPQVDVVVQDFKGNPVAVHGVEGGVSKKTKGNKKALTFVSKGKGSYQASLSGLDIGLGTFEVDVAAIEEGSRAKVASATFTVALTGRVEVPEATLTVKRTDTNVVQKKKSLSHPAMLDKAMDVDANSQLKVAFTVSFPGNAQPFTPQQVFISLKSRVSGAMVLVAAKAAQSSPNDYTATLGPSTIAKQIGTQGGLFDATLSIGDVALAEALVWPLGAVSVSHAPAGEGTAAPGQPPPTAAQLQSAPKPEIQHMFRQPDKRPPAVVSLAFAALSATPLLFLAIRLSQLGVNIKGFPSGTAATYALAFHGGLASILVLYTVFWLRLSLIDTFLPLAGLSLFTFWTGFKALSHHARADIKKE
ncbi:g10381 [Coccomyxa elongata]